MVTTEQQEPEHRPKIGILAIQGDFEAHAKAVREAGGEPFLVKHAGEVAGADGLILPGGESTTVLKFLEHGELQEALRDAARGGKPLFGTCAGAILMAREVSNPPQPSLGLMDIAIRRNAYGRQVSSFIVREPLTDPALGGPLEMVFIRAPVIEDTGRGVRVLGECRGRPVLVREGHLLASTFHPELTSDRRIHRYFVEMARGQRS